MKSFLLIIFSVALLLLMSRPASAQIFYPTDAGFESPDESGTTQFRGITAPWTFSTDFADSLGEPNQAGIASNGTQNLSDATGNQAAYLQNVSSVNQTITLPTGFASVTLDFEGRNPVSYSTDNHGEVTTTQDKIQISLGGIVLFTGTPPANPDGTFTFQEVTTSSTYLLAGNYVLSINGITSGTTSGQFTDSMTFIDNVQINDEAVPEPSSLALLTVGGCALLALVRRRSRQV